MLVEQFLGWDVVPKLGFLRSTVCASKAFKDEFKLFIYYYTLSEFIICPILLLHPQKLFIFKLTTFEVD